MNTKEKQLVEKVLSKFNMEELPYGEIFDTHSMGLNMMVLLGDYLLDELENKFDTNDKSISDVVTFVNRCLTQTTTLTKKMEKDIKGIEDSSYDELKVMVKGIIG